MKFEREPQNEEEISNNFCVTFKKRWRITGTGEIIYATGTSNRHMLLYRNSKIIETASQAITEVPLLLPRYSGNGNREHCNGGVAWGNDGVSSSRPWNKQKFFWFTHFVVRSNYGQPWQPLNMPFVAAVKACKFYGPEPDPSICQRLLLVVCMKTVLPFMDVNISRQIVIVGL